MVEITLKITTIICTILALQVTGDLLDFNFCHDDFTLQPPDGVLAVNTFSWLGFVQYVHVTTGLDHINKAPRVVLIHRQFALATASDVLRLPKNYKLGNVLFGEYNRDEEECGISPEEAKKEKKCPRASIELPISDINPHPEFSRFGVTNSLALVKLLRPLSSKYTLPVCLPTIEERRNLKSDPFVFMVDYLSLVPKDFEFERMGKKTMKLYTHRDCKMHRRKMKASRMSLTHALCTTGCGVRSGAPIVKQSEEGTFELIGLTAGGAPCSNRSSRRRLNDEPPIYADVYPYRTWIVNVVTAHILPYPYPRQFVLTSDGSGMSVGKPIGRLRREQEQGWKARTYVIGDACFRSKKTLVKRYAFFYTETFEVNADPPAKLNFNMKVSAGGNCSISCARLLFPNRYVQPVVEGIGGYNISVRFSTEWFPLFYYFSLNLWGRNATARELESWGHERRPGFW